MVFMTLADISTFPLTVQGNGQINIEVAADTEMSSEAPDDWMVVLAKQFNQENHKYNGKTVTISVRQITGGETVTYMRAGKYEPDLYVPSHAAWGKMLDASGIQTITLCDRLLGNTAGILMSDKVYPSFIEKYGEVTMKNVVEATLAGDLNFAYTFKYRPAEMATITGGLTARINRTEYYKQVADLLGGDYFMDIDTFAERDFAATPYKLQNDLDYYLAHGSAQVLQTGDKYGYDYLAQVRNYGAWVNGEITQGNFSANLGGRIGYPRRKPADAAPSGQGR